jgi:hypothetical protein
MDQENEYIDDGYSLQEEQIESFRKESLLNIHMMPLYYLYPSKTDSICIIL